MLRKCQKSVHLVSNKLSAILYTNPSILDAIESALARNVEFKILVRNDPDQLSMTCFRQLKKSSDLKIFKLLEGNEVGNDFAVFDEKAFRFEEVASHNAVASFNRPDLAAKLQSRFKAAEAHRGENLLACT